MSQKYKNIVVPVRIEGFTKKGNGYGEFESRTVEVPFTMEGDVVQTRLLRKRRGVFKAALESIDIPADNRVAPRCPHFGDCGGCRWQHVPYEIQLKEKMTRIKTAFDGMADIIHPILPCSPPWNYRNKMEYSFSSDLAGNRYLGLMKEGGRGRVFNLTECHLCRPWFAAMISSVREWWQASDLDAYRHFRDTGSLRTLTLREGMRTGDKMVILTVSGNPDYALNRNHLKSFVRAVGPSCSVFLRIHQAIKGKPTQFYEMHLQGPAQIREEMTIFGCPTNFVISPQAFFQPNTAQAEKLYEKAIELAGIEKGDVIYDLYCGTGTLGLLASRKASRVIGIELSPEALLDARENAKLNQCENIDFYQGDVGKVLQKMSSQNDIPAPDIVLVDPPRSGLDSKALNLLRRLNPKKILYVSCQPSTQADNVRELIEFGWRVSQVQPVDQFPQTVHIENIVLLQKDSS